MYKIQCGLFESTHSLDNNLREGYQKGRRERLTGVGGLELSVDTCSSSQSSIQVARGSPCLVARLFIRPEEQVPRNHDRLDIDPEHRPLPDRASCSM